MTGPPAWLRSIRRSTEVVAATAHVFHGTRGLMLGGAGLFILGLAQPLLPRDLSRFWLVAPVFTILAVGLATLPREGVAAQQRARALARHDEAAKRLGKALVWPLLLAFLLLPRIFLGGFGLPHMSPLTGLALPSIQQRVTHVFLFTIILVTAAYLRSSRRYAAHVIAKRPRDLSREDRSHQERDALLWLSIAIFIAYAFLLRSFWQPFSLLAWPPSLDSLRAGVRGVSSIVLSVAVPLVLYTAVTAHASLVRDLIKKELWRERSAVLMLAAAHVALGITCVALLSYNLLWIAQYRASAPF